MRNRTPAGILLVGVLALAACTAGTPEPVPTASTADGGVGLPAPAPPVPLEEIAAFSGVAALRAGSDCTGTLIQTGVADGPAYLLTTARCAGGAGRSAQETTLAAAWTGTAEFFRVAGDLDATVTVEVAELAYATMRHTDAAVVRLDAGLGELERLGARAVPIADRASGAGDAVLQVSVPTGSLEPDAVVMRRSVCDLGAPQTLIESAWLWFDVFPNDCPGIGEGSFGSPLFTADEEGRPKEIAAVVSTSVAAPGGADGGACSEGRPCRLTDAGAQAGEEAGYAQNVAGVGRCFDAATGEFSLGADCPLPVSDVWAERGGGSFRGAGQPDAAGQLPEASFVGTAVGIVRTTLVPLGDGTACTEEETYRDARTVRLPRAGQPWEVVGVVVPAPLPEQEGRFLMCAVSDTPARHPSCSRWTGPRRSTPPTRGSSR
ncbi:MULTISPECIES: hypothetical protein [unclassified Microbacterium]|uniref:hypothetical protein n=1 Tax=unclassified Microbacterium TaxID=2609290 RepID=UPI00214C2AF9|nr:MULTISPECIES: hypothetical protein [unclassified Microbacterium]MCR2811229.1 hypothetical protein [Microbacterium sp. zg.B185]WIM19828.1 hypothetical protein QNO12_03210 [Microbacterium sp. zg-B185]